MRSYKVNLQCRPYSQGNSFKVIFRYGIQFSSGYCYHVRCLHLFLEVDKICKAAQAVHVGKTLRQEDWLLLDHPGIFGVGSNLKIDGWIE